MLAGTATVCTVGRGQLRHCRQRLPEARWRRLRTRCRSCARPARGRQPGSGRVRVQGLNETTSRPMQTVLAVPQSRCRARARRSCACRATCQGRSVRAGGRGTSARRTRGSADGIYSYLCVRVC
eukprot:358278-Prymnesium_polylepis.1